MVLRPVLLGGLLINRLTYRVMPGPRRAWSGLPLGATTHDQKPMFKRQRWILNPETNRLEKEPIKLHQLLMPVVVLSLMWIGISTVIYEVMPKPSETPHYGRK